MSFIPKRFVRNVFIAAIAVSIICGIWLRFDNLSRDSLWSDELFSVGIAYLAGNQPGQDYRAVRSVSLFGLEPEDNFWTWKLADQHPPLYELILRGWIKLAGVSDASVRAPSAIFGCLLVLSGLLLIRLRFELAVYYTSALALSSSLILYSHEARSYSLAALLSGLLLLTAFLDFYHANIHGKFPVISNAAIAIITLSVFTHYYAVLFCGALCLIYAYYYFRDKNYRACFRLFLPYFILLPYLWLARNGILFKVVGESIGLPVYTHTIAQVTGALIEFCIPYLALPILFLVFALVFVGSRRSLLITGELSERAFLGASRLLIVWLFVFVVLVGVAMATAPFFNPRYLIFSVPLLLLTLSIFVSQLQFSPLVKLIGVAVLLGFSLFKSLPTMDAPPGEDYRSAAEYISDKYKPGDRVVGSWKPNMIYYLHYLRRYIGPDVQRNLTGYFGNGDIEEACNNLEVSEPHQKLFFFYHAEHRQQLDTFVKYCSHIYQKVSGKDFRMVSVAVFETI